MMTPLPIQNRIDEILSGLDIPEETEEDETEED